MAFWLIQRDTLTLNKYAMSQERLVSSSKPIHSVRSAAETTLPNMRLCPGGSNLSFFISFDTALINSLLCVTTLGSSCASTRQSKSLWAEASCLPNEPSATTSNGTPDGFNCDERKVLLSSIIWILRLALCIRVGSLLANPRACIALDKVLCINPYDSDLPPFITPKLRK